MWETNLIGYALFYMFVHLNCIAFVFDIYMILTVLVTYASECKCGLLQLHVLQC